MSKLSLGLIVSEGIYVKGWKFSNPGCAGELQ